MDNKKTVFFLFIIFKINKTHENFFFFLNNYSFNNQNNIFVTTNVLVERKKHRRRVETDAKAKVVTSVWGATFIQLPVLHGSI